VRPFLSAGVPVCVCVCVCVDWFSARSTWPAFRWRSPTIGCATAIRGRRAGPSSCCPSTFTAASKTRPTARNGSTLRFDPPRQSPPMPSPSAVALVPLSRFFFFLFFHFSRVCSLRDGAKRIRRRGFSSGISATAKRCRSCSNRTLFLCASAFRSLSTSPFVALFISSKFVTEGLSFFPSF